MGLRSLFIFLKGRISLADSSKKRARAFVRRCLFASRCLLWRSSLPPIPFLRISPCWPLPLSATAFLGFLVAGRYFSTEALALQTGMEW
ncbi:MAG TPA: hypothetical protein DEP42_02290 [Ruminococcaceae bacterium]|nr:hypothetical protein [Oscillospiraceae bacterium]